MKTCIRSLCLLAVILACSGSPQGRITGGHTAILGQVPYQAYLAVAGSPNCGAVILSELYALTAMRCVCSAGSQNPWPASAFSVNAGTIDLYRGEVSIFVEEITLSPHRSEFNTGLALLKLRQPFVFSDYIQPIPLAKNSPVVGEQIEVSGWGRQLDTDSNMQRALQINEGTVINEAECSRSIDKSDSQVFCLDHPRSNGICRGDFGGPAVYQGELVGIAAYVLGECGSYLPDVYTSIASNYDWIVETMSA
ncbi:serine protease SP24D-like [Teleopsis dalmanni]|uniref:serine protease SP24D-like n=1 Tax=Teleopsis dalmanni TaxID=139649 RepID=UPI0018CE909A|nr:serine protease SP24D-like [Teleopsis dalmanni]XP_037942555.1 serine protease SP24D-like [Teleopsis dalmanni]XP_037942565.1 serine protease SP24D-like [Teleopsis dalmanni]XP_037942569.1 serine protease SP24D-like [Teleopsis dalmanni]